MFRALRRFIVKRFGGIKRFFIFVACLGIIIYCLHSLFSSSSSRQVWDVQNSSVNDSAEDVCKVECELGQLSFYIRTGDKNVAGPTVCFQGNIVISHELKNYGRGLNMAVINSKTLEVTEVKYFDTYVDDASLIRYLKKDIPDDSVVMIASYDEASTGLREDSKQLMKLYGSMAVDVLGFRDSYIMIGQRGLKEGHAIEYISKKEKSEDFSVPLQKAGCFVLPCKFGTTRRMASSPARCGARNIHYHGELMPLCGLKEACSTNQVAIGVFTGQENSLPPWICVDGRKVMSENINKGGRGFNVVTLNKDTLQLISTMHADTYTYDSADLELYLESLNVGDIVIAVVADDGAKKLSYSARELLNNMGSGFIQNLRFRDVWFFIGQKGMEGFTTMEQINYSGFDGGWPKPIKQSYCVPKKLVGRKIIPDPEFYRFDERREFCKKYDGYPEFCDPSHVDDQLKTVGVADHNLQGHQIFDTPFIIVPGMNHNALVRTLETALMQPGIRQENVMVMWDEKFPEHGELATLFGFGNTSLPSSTKYMEQMNHAIQHSLKLFPKADHFIVVEEELLLAPDYLSFLAECLSILNSDPTLLGVSAWNFNGFESTSGNRAIVYRVEEFPGLGFLIKKSALSMLAESFGECCTKRAWHGWRYGQEGHFEILMPDVSRVFRQPYQGAGREADFLRELFLRPRTTSLQEPITLENLSSLMESQYEEYLHKQIEGSIVLGERDLRQCVQSIEPPPDLSPENSSHPVAVYYVQETSIDFRLLREISRCFGLVSPRNYKPKNLHNGMLRFWYQEHHVFLIGSSSPYYKIKPKDVEPIALPKL
ncbi:hypothetical protein C0Q70_15078 [Pomacea canaliculata]|uniref:ILEI/PANDER domain-containing protein n=1 Tax=Pomacea canaliculata TaxID=400727 RepID=A0A2T7NTW2_POMCA|nr:hypothetical protein C0Q70_15078 [Pomacea canaliculata]